MIMPTYRLLKLPLLAVLVTFGFQLAYGQNGLSNARSTAMGGAYTAIANGVEAPSWNPANLGLSAKRKYRLNLFSIGLGLQNNSFSTDHYNMYSGATLTEQDKQDILDLIPEDGLAFDIGTEVQALGISFGSIAITASGLVSTSFSLAKDVVDLALNGNELNRTYDVGDADGEAIAYSSLAIATAIPFKLSMFDEFAVGISAKFIKGFAYANVVESSSNLMTNIDGLHGSAQLVLDRAQGGSGFGADVGAAGKLGKDLVLSMSIANLASSINWNASPERFTYTMRADSISVQKIGENDLDSLIVDSDETEALESFSSNLPAQLNFGVAKMMKRLTLGFSMSKGLKKGAGVSTKPRLAFGSELRLIGFLPLRAGYALGGSQGTTASAGFGLDFAFFSWDFALQNRGGVTSGKGLGFAFNWMFRL